MIPEMRIIRWSLLGALAVITVAVGLFSLSVLLSRRAQPLPVYGDVTDFHLTNQVGQVVDLGDLKGKVWVADIIFTRCPGPCLAMTRRMKAVAEALPPSLPVEFISLTADPNYDTPAVLKAYSEQHKADSRRWQFLTGPKEAVYSLATKGLKLALVENAESRSIDEQFIHSTRFVVVDRQGRIRSVSFDGTDPHAPRQVARAVKQLLAES